MLSEKSGLKLFFVSWIFASIPVRTVDIGETAVLLYGNAAVEGGFFINKELIIDSMLEVTVVAQSG